MVDDFTCLSNMHCNINGLYAMTGIETQKTLLKVKYTSCEHLNYAFNNSFNDADGSLWNISSMGVDVCIDARKPFPFAEHISSVRYSNFKLKIPFVKVSDVFLLENRHCKLEYMTMSSWSESIKYPSRGNIMSQIPKFMTVFVTDGNDALCNVKKVMVEYEDEIYTFDASDKFIQLFNFGTDIPLGADLWVGKQRCSKIKVFVETVVEDYKIHVQYYDHMLLELKIGGASKREGYKEQ